MTEPKVEPKATPPNAAGGGKQPDPGGRTFTQEQLDAILADRLDRERTKYSDYDDLKIKAGQLAEIKQVQMSELEKAQTRATALEAERDQALARATDTLIRSAFVAEAAKAGVAHPEDAFALADKRGVKVADGVVTGAAEAVKALADAGRLPMAGKPKAPSLDGGAGGGDRAADKASAPALTEDEMRMARKMRLTPEQYQAGKKKA